jgi:hypothetical protein
MPFTHIPRRRFHRLVFCIAGVYNISWGLYACYDPQWLFRFSGLPLMNHPQIFACLGMVVGLYGIIYFEVARVPERGWLLAAVGLVGKILGPVDWPCLSGMAPGPGQHCLMLPNDLIWWIPFSLLFDAWQLSFETCELQTRFLRHHGCNQTFKVDVSVSV